MLSLIPKMDGAAVTCMNEQRLLGSAIETMKCIHQNLTIYYLSFYYTALFPELLIYQLLGTCPAFP